MSLSPALFTTAQRAPEHGLLAEASVHGVPSSLTVESLSEEEAEGPACEGTRAETEQAAQLLSGAQRGGRGQACDRSG